MSAAIVVGYTATEAGRSAAAFGAALARSAGASLHLVVVLPAEGSRSPIVPKDRAYEEYIRTQAGEWLESAIAELPPEVPARAHVRVAESFAEGLIAAGEDLGARTIVIGTASGSLLGRHRLGSVASELLHSSTVPVALAPSGAPSLEVPSLPRVTVAVGTRPGAEALLEEAAALATDSGVDLRLVSLVAFDVLPGLEAGAFRASGDDRARNVLAAARAALPDDLHTTVEEARGGTVEEAVAGLEWLPGEVVLVGSSRLAQPRRLFLGSTAAKMLRELPVPMIVVPRTRG